MLIVDRAKFLALPAGTLFSKYEPCVFGGLMIKGDSIFFDGGNDFWCQQIADAIDANDSGEFADKLIDAQENGASVGLDLDCQMRDGLFDHDQLFAVWEPHDVAQLIERLQAAMNATTQPEDSHE